jgi:hypothetical protein
LGNLVIEYRAAFQLLNYQITQLLNPLCLEIKLSHTIFSLVAVPTALRPATQAKTSDRADNAG